MKNRGGNKTRYYVGYYLLQVAAAWTKGPAGILIPLGVILTFLVLTKNGTEYKHLKIAWAVPLVIIASLPWFLYIAFFVDTTIMTALAVDETVGRMLGLWGHGFKPLYYYIKILSVGFSPWICFVPWAAWKRLRSNERNSDLLFLEIWIGIVFVFFSLCANKKPQYILSLCAPLSVWVGHALAEAASCGKPDRGLAAVYCILVFLVFGGGVKGLYWVSHHEPSLIFLSAAAFGILVVSVLPALKLSLMNKNSAAASILCLCSGLLLIIFLTFGTTWIGNSRSMKTIVEQNAELISAAETVYSCSKRFTSLVFYTGKVIHKIDTEKVLREKLQSPEPCICFLRKKQYGRFKDALSSFTTVYDNDVIAVSNIQEAP